MFAPKRSGDNNTAMSKKETSAQFETKDQDGVMVTCLFGKKFRVPPAYVCTIALTTPKGKHSMDCRSTNGGNYLTWYNDGGFVVGAGLTGQQVKELLKVLRQALDSKSP